MAVMDNFLVWVYQVLLKGDEPIRWTYGLVAVTLVAVAAWLLMKAQEVSKAAPSRSRLLQGLQVTLLHLAAIAGYLLAVVAASCCVLTGVIINRRAGGNGFDLSMLWGMAVPVALMIAAHFAVPAFVRRYMRQH